MSENTNSLKIPNAYKKLHPLDPQQTTSYGDSIPEGLSPNATIRYILRSGQKGCGRAGNFWWGDRPSDVGSIVAYKVIKLENPWFEWGIKFDRGETLDTEGGVPLALAETNPIVKIWLRDYPIPQEDTRRARSWDWMVSGQSGGDIMKYRLVEIDD